MELTLQNLQDCEIGSQFEMRLENFSKDFTFTVVEKKAGKVKLIENEICTLSAIDYNPVEFSESRLNKWLQNFKEELIFFPCQISIPSKSDFLGFRKYLGTSMPYWLKEKEGKCYYTISEHGNKELRKYSDKNVGVVLCIVFDILEVKNFIEEKKLNISKKVMDSVSVLKEMDALFDEAVKKIDSGKINVEFEKRITFGNDRLKKKAARKIRRRLAERINEKGLWISGRKEWEITEPAFIYVEKAINAW